MIVSDNGSKFTSNANFAPSDQKLFAWRTIVLGKPMQNGFGGCGTNSSNEPLFTSLGHA